LFTFHCILNFGEEEVTLSHVCRVQVVTYVWNVIFGYNCYTV
jgi:hypothetical protein